MSIGRVVCFEGIDGAGKTSLVKSLAPRLSELGLRVHVLHSPSLYDLKLTEQGQTINSKNWIQEQAFISYSRLFDFYREEVESKLHHHDLVILDRFKWSYLVRWGCRDVRWNVLTALDGQGTLVPDPWHTFYLEVDPETALFRKDNKEKPLSKAETGGVTDPKLVRNAFVSFQTRAVVLYDELVAGFAKEKVTRINTSPGQEAVFLQVLDSVRVRLEALR